MERRINFLNWKVFKDYVPHKIDTVILPVGTIEAHGIGPLGTDNLIPEDISMNIAEKINAFIAPKISYGLTHSLLPYPGSLTTTSASFKSYVKDVSFSLSDSGFKKIVIMNGHGGQIQELKEVGQELYEQKKVKSIIVHWWILTAKLAEEFFGEAGGHSALDENAMVFAVYPETVKQELLNDEDMYLYNPGIQSVPIPGSVILYKENQGRPRFNLNEAKEFRKKVIDYIADNIRDILNRWEKI